MDVTNFIGDWVLDSMKLGVLTEERAIQDISMMIESPDYDNEDVDEALHIAAEKLQKTKMYLFTCALGEQYAHKMS